MGRKWRPGLTPKKHRRWKPVSITKKTLRGHSFCRLAQFLIWNVFQFMKAEAANGQPTIPLSRIHQRTTAALKVSKASVTKYVNIVARGNPLETPGKVRSRDKPVRNVDNFTRGAIRNAIYEMHRQRKHITLDILLEKSREPEIGFKGGKETLRKVLLDIGFKYEKINSKEFLKERQHVALKRYSFLTKYVENHRAPEPLSVKSQDETWIYEYGTGKGKTYKDGTVHCASGDYASLGARYIINHIAGVDGWVKGAGTFLKSCKNPHPDDDYHGDMNGETWHNWLLLKCLPNLKEPSLIVMDNAPYHTVQMFQQPTTSWNKREIQEWLKKANVPYEEKMLKEELLHLAKLHKKPVQYKAEDLVKNTAHKILRLPPYHYEWAPIEMGWSDGKRYYNKHIGERMSKCVAAPKGSQKLTVVGLGPAPKEREGNGSDSADSTTKGFLEGSIAGSEGSTRYGTDGCTEESENLEDPDDPDDPDDPIEPHPIPLARKPKETLKCGIMRGRLMGRLQCNQQKRKRRKNRGPSKKDLTCRRMWRDSLKQVTPDKWAGYFRKVHERIMAAWEHEVGYLAPKVSPMIIHLSKDDNSSDSEDEVHGPLHGDKLTAEDMYSDLGVALLPPEEEYSTAVEGFQELRAQVEHSWLPTAEDVFYEAVPAPQEQRLKLRNCWTPASEESFAWWSTFASRVPTDDELSTAVASLSATLFSCFEHYQCKRIITRQELTAAVTSIMIAFSKGGVKSERPDENNNSLCSFNDGNQSLKENATKSAFPETIKSYPKSAGVMNDWIVTDFVETSDKKETPVIHCDGPPVMDSSPILTESTTDAIIISDTEEDTPNSIINSDDPSSCHIPLEAILKMDPNTLVLMKYRIDMRVKDLRTLQDSEWVNDQVINFYLSILQEQCTLETRKIYSFTTFFFSKISISLSEYLRWSKKINFFDFDILLIPVHLGNHWCLCVVQPPKKRIAYYDSMCTKSNATSNSVMNTILQCLKLEYHHKMGTPLQDSVWVMVHEGNVAQQQNTDDCGVFLCWFARRVCENEPCYSSEDVMLNRRQKIMKEIVNCRLQPDETDEHLHNLHNPKVNLWSIPPNLSKPTAVGAGLANTDQYTCFVNSTLQLLFHCATFTTWLLKDDEHRKNCSVSRAGSNCVTCSLAETFLLTQKHTVIDPRLITDLLQEINKKFVPHRQQDAHEFLIAILSKLTDEYLSRYKDCKLDLRSCETTPIHGIFGGYLRTEVTCMTCQETSMTCQSFMVLSLDIAEAKTTEEAIKAFFQREHLSGYHCKKCKKSVDATKMTSIEKPPLILCLQLKRFDHNQRKITKKVLRRPVLSLRMFLHQHSPYKAKTNAYKLLSLITHVGNQSMAGHYYAISQTSLRQFYKFNDASVQLSSLKECLDDEGYILFHAQI